MFRRLRHALVERHILYKEYHAHRRLLRELAPTPEGNRQRSLVIIPCAPDSVIGSRADEAMIVTAMQQFRDMAGRKAPITVVCAGEFENPGWPRLAQRYGAELLKAWKGANAHGTVARAVAELAPTDICILGADGMDGHYSPFISFGLLSLYTLFYAKGYNVSLLGFSYSDHPHPTLNRLFRKVAGSAPFHLRDPLSQKRFRQSTRIIKARLVADAAFLLRPDQNSDAYRRYRDRVNDIRLHSAIVIAFNFRPMLRPGHTADELEASVQRMAETLRRLLDDNPGLAIALLPHDDCKRLSDNYVLRGVYDRLKDNYSDCVIYVPQVYRAEEIKAIVGLFDGVISSHMHLAIAALGMNVPVMAAECQGQVRGLFAHFDYPEQYLLTPEQFCGDAFLGAADVFVANLRNLKLHILTALPKVRELSRKNFEPTVFRRHPLRMRNF